VHAILTHADHTGIPRITLMEKALYACDEVTGMITAVALVRPSRSLYDLEASSVRKKWKDKALPAAPTVKSWSMVPKSLALSSGSTLAM